MGTLGRLLSSITDLSSSACFPHVHYHTTSMSKHWYCNCSLQGLNDYKDHRCIKFAPISLFSSAIVHFVGDLSCIVNRQILHAWWGIIQETLQYKEVLEIRDELGILAYISETNKHSETRPKISTLYLITGWPSSAYGTLSELDRGGHGIDKPSFAHVER